MNYVGSISILDRGDAPAQAVIDRNARSLAQRVADETKEELAKVLNRVEHIYGNFELSQTLLDSNKTSLEYVQDLGELESLINDQVKKKKYQQQVTIFIVGFENTSGQKLRLLQQVNEFFVESANKFDEDDILLASPDLDLDSMEETVEETLRQTETLANKLANLKKGLDDHMHNLTQMKTSNKKGAKKSKDLEKDLSGAKKQLDAVNSSLRDLAKEVKEKSDKIDQLQRDIERRNVDVLRYKKMAEDAKKVGDYEKLREELDEKTEEVRELRLELERMKVEVGKEVTQREQSPKNTVTEQDENLEKIRELEFALEEQVVDAEQNQQEEPPLQTTPQKDNSELIRLHEEELYEIKEQHQKDIEFLKNQHAGEIKALLQSVNGPTVKDLPSDPGDRSRPVTKEASRLSRQGSNERQDSKASSSKSTPPQGRSNGGNKNGNNGRERSTASDEGNQEDTQSKLQSRPANKSRSNLEPVQEVEAMEFEDEFDLKDDQAWTSVPVPHIPGRFLQYRQLTKKKLEDLEGTIDSTVKKTARKMNTLKAQFHEHKVKWEKEREVLIAHIEEAEVLQSEAEKEADTAMEQLEEFIKDQEELEKEEEGKRSGLAKSEREATLSLADAEENLRSTLEEQAAVEQDTDLLAQTDDAKAELSRKASKLSEQSASSETLEDQAQQSPDRPSSQREDTRSRTSITDRKYVLSALKASADQRRARSPSIFSIKSRKSVLSDAELDENGDMPFPQDESKEERETRLSLHDMATSPFPFSRENTLGSQKGIPMSEHPIVLEFKKAYDAAVHFKENLCKAFMDKDMTSLGIVLAEIEPPIFNPEGKVQPQIEKMTKAVATILEESMLLLIHLLNSEKDYPVSSILGSSSKDTSRIGLHTRESLRTKEATEHGKPVSRPSSTKEHMKELQDKYAQLEKHFEDDQKKHAEQLNHNTVVMMEMQDTINGLQRELSTLNHQAADLAQKQQESGTPKDAPVMFTRLDSERNSKIMKRAVNERRLDPEKYEKAVGTMEDYVNLPAKRLAHLVNKYVHHVQMKQVEENVRHSKTLDEDVFHVLDKMESLQNERAKKWADKMDEMGDDRIKIVTELMSTLDEIERESGVFLIKPMYSYKGSPEVKYQSKMSRANRPPPRESRAYSRTGSAYAPVPTPEHKMRGIKEGIAEIPIGMPTLPSHPEDGVSGKSSNLLGDYPRPVWNQSHSTSSVDPRYISSLPGQINTPRILELDVNRMLIGQNQVSIQIPKGFVSNDRLANAANSSTRSYVTVNRPIGQPTAPDRPRSHTGISDAPPATPMANNGSPQTLDGARPQSTSHSAGSNRHQQNDASPRTSPIAPSHQFPSTPPLPPIGTESPLQEYKASCTDSVSSFQSESDKFDSKSPSPSTPTPQ